MRILHVIDVLNVGGAERMFISITALLTEMGVDVDVLLFDNAGPLTGQLHPKLKVYNFERKNKYSLAKLWEAQKRYNQYDIVHVHMRHCYAYVRLAQLMFGGKYRIVLHDHNGMNKNVTLGLRYFFKPVYYIGVSRDLCDWAIKTVGVDRKKTYLLGNTIIPSVANYRFELRNAVMLISNIRRIKNIEFAIKLFRDSSSKLVIYGNIIDQDYYSELLALIGNSENIQIVSGVEDFSSLYNQFDLAIHCSKAESGPLVLLEYMACGIPFLAYKTGDVAEKLFQQLPVYFIDTFDEQAWSLRIKEIRQQNGHKEVLQNAFQQYFSPSTYVEECIRIYQSVSS